MPAITYPSPPVTTPLRPAPLRPASVFLPKEHGSWSLALEPLALGLLVAPSHAGGALALAALAAFFARRPARLVFDPSADFRRRRVAQRTLALFGGLALVGFALAVSHAGLGALWPLGLAMPFAALFAAFDAHGEGRSALAELSGAAAFAAVPAACATLIGWPHAAALALGAVIAGRSVPTVLLVRSCLRARKTGDSAGKLAGPLAALATLLAVAYLQRAGLVPPLAFVAAALLLARAVWLASPSCRHWSGRRIGTIEVFVGLAYLVLLTVGYRLT